MYSMKVYGAEEIQLHSFLTSALDGSVPTEMEAG
jgi:hypothetical protein